jgi:hypothetical protein
MGMAVQPAARTHRILTWVCGQRGDHRQALEHATRTLDTLDQRE